tara:strand:- start:25 stop:1095 length:1071 start_codon:yes stop_codon:yes gene_type:complete
MAITLIVWVVQGVNLLDIVTEKGHSIRVYFFYSLLNLPKILGKLLVFTYFLTLFVILNRYEENNEILIFWTNGIKKIYFINFILRFSILFVSLQLILNLFIVPTSQKMAQDYLRNSSLDFFPKLIEEKKFSNVMENLTIFVDEYEDGGNLKGVYIKEKLKDNGSKIIIASSGKLNRNSNGFSFKLLDGKITNQVNNNDFSIAFEETNYDLSSLDTKIRKLNKLSEENSLILFLCLKNNFIDRKDLKFIRCGEVSDYSLRNIYEEFFKRVINPIYIIILSLISTLIILKSKFEYMTHYFKFFLFFLGFSIILFSELSYKFVSYSVNIEILFIIMPIILIFIFYLYILLKSKFKLSYL